MHLQSRAATDPRRALRLALVLLASLIWPARPAAAATLAPLVDINQTLPPYQPGSYPNRFVELSGRAYFSAADAANGASCG